MEVQRLDGNSILVNFILIDESSDRRPFVELNDK